MNEKEKENENAVTKKGVEKEKGREKRKDEKESIVNEKEEKEKKQSLGPIKSAKCVRNANQQVNRRPQKVCIIQLHKTISTAGELNCCQTLYNQILIPNYSFKKHPLSVVHIKRKYSQNQDNEKSLLLMIMI